MNPEQKLGARSAAARNDDPSGEPSASSGEPSKGQPQTMLHPDDLHNLFATTDNFDGDDPEDPLAQLRNDPNYSALIRDLEYIAKEARALFQPADETPSDDLWKKIQSQLPAKPDAN
jgi:hypothetical protein